MTEQRLHEECQRVLPWYANETLAQDEQDAVESHLAACGACRAELAALRDVQVAVRDEPTQTEADGSEPGRTPRGFDDVLARIEAEEAELAPRGAPGWQRWMIVGQAAAIAVLATLLLVRAEAPGSVEAPRPTEPFLTLSTPTVEQVPAAAVRVVFRPTATERQIRDLLHQVDAEIVGGPSEVGAYAVQLHDADRVAAAVDRLRESSEVRLAEPIDATR